MRPPTKPPRRGTVWARRGGFRVPYQSMIELPSGLGDRFMRGFIELANRTLKEPPVSSNRTLSLIAALAMSAVGSSLAQPETTSSKPPDAKAADAPATQPEKPKKKKKKKHPNKTELDKAERG